MPPYTLSLYDIYIEPITIQEYAVDPDFLPYPMTEADIGEFQYYESLANDIVQTYQSVR